MKKTLLLIGLCLSITAFAQDRRINSTGTNESVIQETQDAPAIYKMQTIPSVRTTQSAARRINPGNHTTAVSEVQIGSSGNCFGPAFGPKTNLWYDQDINSIAFTHRSTVPTNGMIYYDVSTDGGATWNIDLITAGDPTNVQRCRYPHGVIYNPTGNTDPTNAFITTVGPITDGGATGFCTSGWTGFFSGNAKIGNAPNHIWHNYECSTNGLNFLIPSGGQIIKNTGAVYWVVNGFDGTDYNDSITLIKGIWNTTGDSMDYEFVKMYAPMCIGAAGTKLFVDVQTAWNDDGDVGYISVIGNDWLCGDEPIDSTFGLIVWKTADGGATWTKLGRPWMSLLDPWLANGNFFCTTAFEHDDVVDKNDNLHMAVAVGAYAGNSSISTGPGFWALFDINTPDQGASWQASIIGRPMTFRGNFGNPNNTTADPTIGEDNRPQCSRSWDGSKLFFTWFDTDTIIFGSASGNIFPDMFSIGYDVDAQMWTSQVNHTQFSGTTLDGACYWGNVSYYTINNGTDECIPMVGGAMVSPPISTGSLLTYYYINGACMSNYNDTNIVIPLNEWLGTGNHQSNSNFSVSSNYPNPYNGLTSVDVTLPKVGDVTIEISNAAGQILSTKVYTNLHAGVNTLTIDGSSLSKGLYFYSVKAGREVFTKTMSVE